jgi:4-hydroxy-3-methylbut-2-enyl diphosphate reductase
MGDKVADELHEVLLAEPRGFCAGVDRAIEIVERALKKFGAPIYVRHEIVHNTYVVNDLKAKGAIFIEDLADVPPGATLVFSAHGVSQAVRAEARERELRIFDATCPLVTKVHIEVARHARQGRDVVLIGHAGHPEVEGTMGQWDPKATGRIHLVESPADVASLAPSDPAKLAFSTQTTLSVDEARDVITALRARFPQIEGPRHDDICYATQNRQDAVRELAARVDLVLVIGSPNSSNSNRLRELAEKQGIPAYLIDGPQDIRREWVEGKATVGVTAGASAPESLVQGVVARLREWGAGEVRDLEGQPENMVFALPKELRLIMVE